MVEIITLYSFAFSHTWLPFYSLPNMNPNVSVNWSFLCSHCGALLWAIKAYNRIANVKRTKMMLFFFYILFYLFFFFFKKKIPHPEPSSLLPPHTIPLGRPSAPAPSIQHRALNLDWHLVSYMTFHMFQCPSADEWCYF